MQHGWNKILSKIAFVIVYYNCDCVNNCFTFEFVENPKFGKSGKYNLGGGGGVVKPWIGYYPLARINCQKVVLFWKTSTDIVTAVGLAWNVFT